MSRERPHRKLVKHRHRTGDLHELAFSCYRRRPLLTNDTWRHWLADSLSAAGQRCQVRLAAFVFMPEHLHLLVWFDEPGPPIRQYLSAIKQPFARRVAKALSSTGSPLLQQLMVRERPGRSCFRFWQEGSGFDRNLFTPRAIAASLDYIHGNPVARGLCRRAVDWKWSSARWYLEEPPKQQDPALPSIAGLPAGCFDRSRIHDDG